MERKVTSVLLLATFCYSFTFPVDRNHESQEIFGEFNEFEKVCPKLWLEIKKSHIDEYATNCSYVSKEDAKNHILSVRKDICLLVNDMLSIICRSGTYNRAVINAFSSATNQSYPCPIKLSFNEEMKNPLYKNVSTFLSSEGICYQVCYDFKNFEKLCSVLLKINDLVSGLRSLPVEGASYKPFESSFHPTQNRNEMINPTDNRKEKVNLTENRNEKINPTQNKNEKINMTDSKNGNINPTENRNEKIKPTQSRNEKIKPTQSRNEMIDSKISSLVSNEKGVGNKNVSAVKSQTLLKPIHREEGTVSLTKSSVVNNKSDMILTKSSTNEETNKIVDEVASQNEVVGQEEPVNENLDDDFEIPKTQPVSNEKYLSNEEIEPNIPIDPNLNVNEVPPPKQNNFIETPNQQHQGYSGGYLQSEDSHFFFYFLMFSSVIILGYFAFHNKNKILAYALEGRSDRRSRRRPNPAKYRKLETNLEEAIASNVPQASTSTVVY